MPGLSQPLMPKCICVSNIVCMGKACVLPIPNDKCATEEMLMLAGLNYISRDSGTVIDCTVATVIKCR